MTRGSSLILKRTPLAEQVLGVDDHRPELQADEPPAIEAHPRLAEEDRPGRAEPDQQGHDRQDRREQEQAPRGPGQVHDPLRRRTGGRRGGGGLEPDPPVEGRGGVGGPAQEETEGRGEGGHGVQSLGEGPIGCDPGCGGDANATGEAFRLAEISAVLRIGHNVQSWRL